MLYVDGPTNSRPNATPNRYGLPGLFRNACLGMERQSSGFVRGLERPCDVCTSVETARRWRQRLRSTEPYRSHWLNVGNSKVGDFWLGLRIIANALFQPRQFWKRGLP